MDQGQKSRIDNQHTQNLPSERSDFSESNISFNQPNSRPNTPNEIGKAALFNPQENPNNNGQRMVSLGDLESNILPDATQKNGTELQTPSPSFNDEPRNSALYGNLMGGKGRHDSRKIAGFVNGVMESANLEKAYDIFNEEKGQFLKSFLNNGKNAA